MMKSFRALSLVVSTAVRVSPWQSAVSLGESIANILQVLQPLFLSLLVVGALKHDANRITVAGIAFVASVAVDRILLVVGAHARIGQLERVGYAFSTRIAEVTARIPTLDHLESPRYLDQMQTTRDQEGSLGVALNTLLNVIADVLRIVGTLILASTADWRMMFVVAAGIPSLLAVRWHVRWAGEAEQASAQFGRLTTHLLRLGVEAPAGSEIRVFGVRNEMRRRLRAASQAWRHPFTIEARRQAVMGTVNDVVFFGVAGAVLAWMTYGVMARTTGIEALILALMLVNRLKSAATDLQESARGLGGVIRIASRFLWLLDYERAVRRQHGGTAKAPARLTEGITLEDLSFTYPNSERAALDGISLHLRPGIIVALVGENGAGKSTLVKLFAGLYRPTRGRIVVDGRDLSDLDIEDWRHAISAAFQDHAMLELTAQEAVGVGNLPDLRDRARVSAAVTTGAAEGVIASLPQGLNTQLGVTWRDGVGLSGGQWQRLALARGMMRRQPLLLVLDEPTASLDATTEHELFERYTQVAMADRRAGTITLLVTHRFSTVSAADLIVVLDNGKLIELGTHTELLEADGHYAELYKLQARGYV